ncbi:putative CDP-glycerol:glycerophosphate glycerophosphotransferase [Clostridium chromiireducens]|uniref:Putative CDP-glycerol:glycerophosphate glycerophosphotransferase n=2 Tax=Clostridium chromiireducens TaxID=225345 RepID=A0A1V4IXL8_9CLOT|nr:putative CDP-glycerol:glycerophosphate glycerophosphotransferase [Clostridium chromiireducens]
MKIKKCTIHKLNKIIKNREIICFGAGNALKSLCSNYRYFYFEKYIKYIVDNDQNKVGNIMNLNGKDVIIHSYDYLTKNIKSNDVILISNKYYSDEIAKQLMMSEKLKNVECYFYPNEKRGIASFFQWFAKKFPLSNTLLFQGPGDFYENSYAIRDYLVSAGLMKKYKLVWIVNSDIKCKDTTKEKYIVRNCLKYSTSIKEILKYVYYFSTAKYIFYESAPIPKYRDEQKLVFLGHGAYSLKKSKGIIVTSRMVDYVLCPSEKCIAGVCDQTRAFEDQIFICGCPRNDILFSKNRVIDKVVSVDKNQKIIIWMPTMRQASWSERKDSERIFAHGLPLLEGKEDFEQLNNLLGELNMILVVKPHPFQRLSVYDLNQYDNIKFVLSQTLLDKNINLYELMKDTDALISDYSSVSFDYMLLNKPIAYAIDDMKEYKLGFAMDNPLEFMPGHHLLTKNDLFNFISDIANTEDRYKEKRKEICDFVHKYQDGENSKRVIEFLGIGSE